MKKDNQTKSPINVGEDLKPSQTLSIVWKSFLPKSKILDLGCGAGVDSLFLAQNNFLVTAVDHSAPAIRELKKFDYKNLEVILDDIRSFSITKSSYDVVICRNVLNFIDKKDANKKIEEIITNISKGSYVIIEVFTNNDPSFLGENRFACYFEEQELLKIFSSFKILYYLENMILDQGHPGFPAPHRHGVARIIAQKLN
jgi:SAM-dependent methyltransferase